MNTETATAKERRYPHLFYDPPKTREELRQRAKAAPRQLPDYKQLRRMLRSLRRKATGAQQGHAPRESTNSRSSGSRRGQAAAAASSPSSSEDPPGDPEPASYGGRRCGNTVAHERFGGTMSPNGGKRTDDLDALGIPLGSDYCHRNCQEQAYEIRSGKTKNPRRLASPPPGWSLAPTIAKPCKCPSEHPFLNWLSPRDPICGYCGRRVNVHRLVFGSDTIPAELTQRQLARLLALCAQQRRAARTLKTDLPTGVPPPRFSSTSVIDVHRPTMRNRPWGEKDEEVAEYSRERAAQRTIAEDEAIKEFIGTESPDPDGRSKISLGDVPSPDEARDAAEAHGDVARRAMATQDTR